MLWMFYYLSAGSQGDEFIHVGKRSQLLIARFGCCSSVVSLAVVEGVTLLNPTAANYTCGLTSTLVETP